MKGRGGGKTPERLVQLINLEVKEKSLNSISKTTGVGISALHRYQRGIGEPTTATLEKLAVYFGVSVAWLRGEADAASPDTDLLMRTAREFCQLALAGNDPDGYYLRLSGIRTALALLGYDADAREVKEMMISLTTTV